MYPSTNFSITAIHGNGGGGFRFDLARPLFPDNVNFHNPSLPGFDCNKKQTKKLTIKEYADWLADYISDVPRPNILMGHGLGGVFVLEFLQKYSYLMNQSPQNILAYFHHPILQTHQYRELSLRPNLLHYKH